MNGTGSLRRYGDCTGVDAVGLRRAAVCCALGLMLAAAAAIVWRRLAGALIRPLDPAMLLFCTALVVAAAAAIRIAWRPARRNLAVMLPLSLAAVGMAVGLCLPGTPVFPLATVLLLVASEECWAWIGYLRRKGDIASMSRNIHIFSSVGNALRGVPGVFRGDSGGGIPEVATISAERDRARSLQEKLSCESLIAPAAEVVEQMSRRRTPDGAEEIAGWLRVSFASGQRTAAAHAAFCPPLGAMPELSFEQFDGPAARIKPGQVLPFGIRLDLKLAVTADAPVAVLLRFTARAKAD